MNSVYTDDRYLGRILAGHVTPPCTAVNLKRYLSFAEDIDEDATTKLFISASSPTPMHDATRLSIFEYPRPGCKPNEPMALVVMFTDEGRGEPLVNAELFNAPNVRRPEVVLSPPPERSQEGRTPYETQYCMWFDRLSLSHCLINPSSVLSSL
jgi:hypothetical protein